ncbi:N-6 DNA methylase [Psychromicrobium sp. YIM B11713]|uniref:N-6 DNA methylase n=1 Tax=Psychromicrobium sp. YIM B11713 TaxID=3145233 RepID=UPI00374FA568
MKLLEANAREKRLSQVFDDFVEMSALSIRNAVDRLDHDEREFQYLRIADQYDRSELDRFGHALALVTLEMEREPCDVLGHLYMDLGLGNKRMGQFFTPYDVAKFMAELQLGGLTAQINETGWATLYEPACGAAGFAIAASQALRHAGNNPQRQLHVTAEDLAPAAVHMAYIHLSLLHIPALVHRRNTLTQELYDTWRTPAHVLGSWDSRLRHGNLLRRM